MQTLEVVSKARRTLTSAWIETFNEFLHVPSGDSRTLTSAWIETMWLELFDGFRGVALSRVRGLKRVV